MEQTVPDTASSVVPPDVDRAATMDSADIIPEAALKCGILPLSPVDHDGLQLLQQGDHHEMMCDDIDLQFDGKVERVHLVYSYVNSVIS